MGGRHGDHATPHRPAVTSANPKFTFGTPRTRPRYVTTGSNRRDRSLSAPGWFMGSQNTVLDSRSEFRTRVMFSLDELTIHGRGFPELLQTGETNRGFHLHDHQHPHNAVGEVSIDYDRLIGRNETFSLYVADPGEPALGPPAFMHRRIGWDMPDPPMSHHWSDSTHTPFGVVTAGLCTPALKLEASTFTGREPINSHEFQSRSPRLVQHATLVESQSFSCRASVVCGDRRTRIDASEK